MNQLEFGVPAELASNDEPIGWRSYKLATPLAPGATTDLAFDLQTGAHGFTNTGAFTDVEYNGSFVNGQQLLPLIGYQTRGELTADRERKKFGLPPSERVRDRDDPAGLAENGIAPDADFITFETTVGTEDDQFAIAPGYLQKEWVQDGRRYFEYKMDSADPQLLRVPVGTLRRKEGPLERRRHRGLLPARARVQPRPDDRGDQGRARLLHRQLRPVPAQAVPDHRVPALPGVRAVVSQHDSVLGGHRLHRPRARGRQGRHRLSVLRDGARARPPVVGPPGGGRRRPGRHDAGGDAGAVLGADGDEAQVRRGEDAAVPAVRARPLSAGPQHRAEEGAAAVARREPAVHPLPQGQPRHVRAAGLHRRGEPQSRDPRVPRRACVQGPAVPEHHAIARAHPRRHAAAPAVRHRRHVRDHHALRQSRDERHGAGRCPTAATR